MPCILTLVQAHAPEVLLQVQSGVGGHCVGTEPVHGEQGLLEGHFGVRGQRARAGARALTKCPILCPFRSPGGVAPFCGPQTTLRPFLSLLLGPSGPSETLSVGNVLTCPGSCSFVLRSYECPQEL